MGCFRRQPAHARVSRSSAFACPPSPPAVHLPWTSFQTDAPTVFRTLPNNATGDNELQVLLPGLIVAYAQATWEAGTYIRQTQFAGQGASPDSVLLVSTVGSAIQAATEVRRLAALDGIAINVTNGDAVNRNVLSGFLDVIWMPYNNNNKVIY